MRLSVEWVSRDYNVEADQLSRINDPNDYMLDPACFRYIDQLWGPHTVDRFVSGPDNQKGSVVDTATQDVKQLTHLQSLG